MFQRNILLPSSRLKLALEIEALCSFATLVFTYSLQSVITQKATIDIFTTMRTSNLI
jgi:hypothetical protein